VCCSVLQVLDVLSCVALCCSVLQCVAVCCSVLQCIRRHRDSNQYCLSQREIWCCEDCWEPEFWESFRQVSLLQCAAARCSVCSVLQCVVVCCIVLQCVAVCCSVLQCGAVLFASAKNVGQHNSVSVRVRVEGDQSKERVNGRDSERE